MTAALARIAALDTDFADARLEPRSVASEVAAMPLSDTELALGARNRAVNALRAVSAEGGAADYGVGLEGGFHSLEIAGAWRTFLKGWACVTDGARESYGATPAILVPGALVQQVVDGGRELGEVIDLAAGAHDIRSKQGAWGVLSRDLVRRADTFEVALIAAFAPFYNSEFY